MIGELPIVIWAKGIAHVYPHPHVVVELGTRWYNRYPTSGILYGCDSTPVFAEADISKVGILLTETGEVSLDMDCKGACGKLVINKYSRRDICYQDIWKIEKHNKVATSKVPSVVFVQPSAKTKTDGNENTFVDAEINENVLITRGERQFVRHKYLLRCETDLLPFSTLRASSRNKLPTSRYV